MTWTPDSLKLGSLPAAASDAHYELHLAAVEHEMSSPILIESKADILSTKHWQAQIEPYEHQIRNLITFCRRAPVALIADDVGLGKTVSAGLILNELQVRKKVRRALVLCPAVLVDQWAEELASKFGMPRIATGTGSQLDGILRSSAAVVVTTYESARDRMPAIAKAGFDMAVLDEAHKLRNLTGTDDPPRLALAVYAALQQRAFRYVLMLTATPVQNRVWDIYSLVACLAAAKGHDNPLGDEGSFRARYLTDKEGRQLDERRRDEFRRHIQEYMVRTSRLTAGLSFPRRLLQTMLVQAEPHEQDLYRQVGAAIDGLPKLAQFSIAESLLSSPRALQKQLANMAANGTVKEDVVRRLAPALAAVGVGCKLAHVLGVCRELAGREPARWRCLVFTRRTETQELIAEALRQHGVAVGLIRGGQAIANRSAIERYRQEPPQLHVLVSTDAGAVGLNLQAGNVIVNYDLPWNPMVLEQRIGRAQRIGSRFDHVLVWNLAVAGTVEDLIVARLVEKLHAVSQTLGEVEGVLEAANLEDDYEGDLGALVTKALVGANVQEAMRKAQASIDRAKAIYAAEQQAVERDLGRLDAMHESGPRAPKLTPARPRLPADEFCRRAFAAAGAVTTPDGPQRLKVRMPGRAPWTAVFAADDPLLDDPDARLGDSAYRLYEAGSPDFERLAGEWRKQHGQRVLDLATDARAAIAPALARWAATLGAPARLEGHTVLGERPAFQGELVVRAAAAVAHDRYEKLVTVAAGDPAAGELPQAALAAAAAVAPVREFAPARAPAIAARALQQAIEQDRDIAEFRRFYEARSQEEVGKAGASVAAQHDVRTRFAVGFAGELVGASGVQHLVVDVQARFALDGAPGPLTAALTLAPLTDRVLAEPPRERCAVTGAMPPAAWLVPCAVTGRRALPSALRRCAITGDLALADELAASGVSGRPFRRDQAAASAASGVRGHASEFVRCEATGQWLLPAEAQRSSVSDRLVDRRLLQPSGRDPSRVGTADEFVVCAATGVRLLRDEASPSAVSGQLVDRDLLAVSAVSGRAALPAEMVRCEATGALVLPDEAARSDHSGRLVDARRLLQSAVSGRRALAEETARCEATGALVLPDELAVSDVSGKRVRRDALVACTATGAKLLREEAVASAFSGRLLAPAAARASAASGRPGAPDEFVACAATGAQLLPDETGVCAATGQRIDARLLARSDVSGAAVAASLLRRCPETGARGTEAELQRCSQTNLLVAPSALTTCTATGERVLARLCAPCAATGRMVRRDRLVRSDSGRLGHPDAVAACLWTRSTLLRDELWECPLTRQQVSRTFAGPWAAAPLVALAQAGVPDALAGPDADGLAAALADAGHKVRGLRCQRAPGGDVAAFFADASTFFGLKKKHVLGFGRRDGERWTVLAAAVGRRDGGRWPAD
jgi:superfamily II DNA or RNA helicase